MQQRSILPVFKKNRVMERVAGDKIEDFIRLKRDEFDTEVPDREHAEKFLTRLNRSIREMISIVPYLVRVAVATILIFIASVIVWDNYIRKDRHEISLRQKVTIVVRSVSWLF